MEKPSNGGKIALPMTYDKFGQINWAGERHPRLAFNKYKDELKDWTNILFRA